MLGFDDYADIAARLDDDRRAASAPRRARPARPPHPAADQPPVRAAAARAAVRRHGWRYPSGTLGRRPRAAAPPAGRRPGRAAEARVRLRPAMRVLRDPAFRGAFVSRPPDDILAEAGWLAADGVRELVLVSENSTSYGKDLGDLRAAGDSCCRSSPRSTAIVRVRVSYLQPAELRPAGRDDR